MEVYRPEVIWMQCGADSIQGDNIGCFNLSIKGHGHAVQKVLSKNIPTVFTGGGGYNVENVSRCWAYETALINNLETDLFKIPSNSKFKNEYSNNRMFYTRKNIHKIHKDHNTPDYISKIMKRVFMGISKIDNSLPFLERIDMEGQTCLFDRRFQAKEDDQTSHKEQETQS